MNNLSQIFFHIHYCNGRKVREAGVLLRRITRTLDHHELIMVTGGKGSLIIAGKKYPFQAGMLFYIAPGVPHTLGLDTDETAAFLTVHFSFVRVQLEEQRWSFPGSLQGVPLQPAQQLRDYYQIEESFIKMVDCWNAKLPGYEFAVKTLFQQLLVTIAEHRRRQDQNYAISLKVERIIEHMHSHLGSKISLTELAGMVQLSYTYLSRVFKEVTGYSVIEFFNKLKMDQAKVLLLEGDMKIKDVAQTLGYNDEFYFSRLFKKTEGVSPSEFQSKKVQVN